MFQSQESAPSSGSKGKGIRKSGCLQGVYQLRERDRPMHNVMDVVINLQRVIVGSSEINPGRTPCHKWQVNFEIIHIPFVSHHSGSPPHTHFFSASLCDHHLSLPPTHSVPTQPWTKMSSVILQNI